MSKITILVWLGYANSDRLHLGRIILVQLYRCAYTIGTW